MIKYAAVEDVEIRKRRKVKNASVDFAGDIQEDKKDPSTDEKIPVNNSNQKPQIPVNTLRDEILETVKAVLGEQLQQHNKGNNSNNFNRRNNFNNNQRNNNRGQNQNAGGNNRRKPMQILISNIHYTTTKSVEVLGNNNRWISVSGCLDSGAGKTVGSVQVHKKLCSTVEEVRNPIEVCLGDNKPVSVTHVGTIEARVTVDKGKPIYFGTLKIFLVDSDSWTDLFIGRDTLANFGALPEQLLSKLSDKERAQLHQNAQKSPARKLTFDE